MCSIIIVNKLHQCIFSQDEEERKQNGSLEPDIMATAELEEGEQNDMEGEYEFYMQVFAL